MPRNTLDDLANLLFEQIDRLNDDEMDLDKLHAEIDRVEAIGKTASRIMDIAELQLDARKHMDEYGYTKGASIRMLGLPANE